MDLYLSVFTAVSADDLSIRRFQYPLCFLDAFDKHGADQDLLISRLKLVNAGDLPVHPVAHRAVSIMVQGIHARFVKCAVRFYGIPSLPDCRSPHIHCIQP